MKIQKIGAMILASLIAVVGGVSMLSLGVSAQGTDSYDFDYGYDSDYNTISDEDAAGAAMVSMIITIVCSCVGLAVWIGITIWIYKDAQKNGVENPVLWALLTFFLGLIGVILYFVVGKKNKQKAPIATAKE